MESDDFLAHYGVKGMRWGRTTKGASAPTERQVKRAQYKSDLKSGREKTNPYGKKWAPTKLTDSEKQALRTNGNRRAALTLGIVGAQVVATIALGKAMDSASSRLMSDAATKGAQFNTRNMSVIGNLSTYTLRQGANGAWG